jgi:tetratricopeptide (TPR) repeat protein
VQALISGFIGQALLVEGGVFRSLRVDRSATPTPASPGDVRNFLARATDAYALEDTQVEQVLEALEAAWEGTAIFNLVQILTSPFEDDDTRNLAAEELDDSLKDQAAVAFAERSLFSAPWPTEITRPANCSSRVAAFLDRLGNVQTAIKSVDRAFGLVDLQLMRLDQEVFRDRFFATSIREGIFRLLVLYMSGEASRAEVHFAIDKSPSLKSFKNSREILTGWLRGLGNPERSAQSIGPRSTEQREFEENDTPSRSPRISKRKRIGLDRQNEHERVMSSQIQIESLLKEGKVDWAIENTRALIEEQIRKSGNGFACKTLSSLAARAQELGMHKLQLEWAREALSLNPDDPFAANQVAHAMLKNGAINEALTAYDQVIEQFPRDVVAKNGRAETLRSLGKYSEALTAYDQVIEQFPENVVAKSGRAETLRSLGKYSEALTAYDQVIEQFPWDVFARAGRAETLRSLGKYSEALTAYDQVIEQFPENRVAKNGRAETLRSLGKYAEALTAYEQVIEQFPENAVARTGYVCVLVDQKEYDRALRQIESRLGPSPIPQTQDDWIDFHIRAMIYLKKGDLVAAEQDMRFGLKRCQLPKSKAYFASGLAIIQMKQNAPRDALQTMTKENSFLPVPQLIRGLVLYENLDLQTAMAEIDQLDDAATFIHKIRHEMKLKYIDRSPASQSTDWFLDQLSNLLLAA